MALVTRFEDLHAWQEARRLARLTYQATRETALARDRSLSDQIRRAATSTVTNIAEGFGSGSNAEFRRFLRYAIRSAAEVQSCLYIACDQEYLLDGRLRELYESAERVKSLCSGLVRRLSSAARRDRVGNDRIAEGPARWLVNQHRGGYGRTARRHSHVNTSARQHVSTPFGAGR